LFATEQICAVLSTVLILVLWNTNGSHLPTLLQVPQLTESFQVILTNTTGEAQLGEHVEAMLIVTNHNFAIYFNGYCVSFHWQHFSVVVYNGLSQYYGNRLECGLRKASLLKLFLCFFVAEW